MNSEMYCVEVSPTLISNVTDEVIDEVKQWQNRPLSPNEGAKFWLSVLTEIHNRGVKDILIACVDGLTGFPNV